MTDSINKEHELGILDAIESNPIYSFKDIFVYYKNCSRATAYVHNLDKLDSIKEAILNKKRKGVTSTLAKWLESKNATLQIAAMRLICDDDERKMLNQSYIDHTTGGDKIQPPVIQFYKTDDKAQ